MKLPQRRQFLYLAAGLGGAAALGGAASRLAAQAQWDDRARALQLQVLRLQAEAAAGKIGSFISAIEHQVGSTTEQPVSAATIEQRRFDQVADPTPPRAAAVKSRGGERRGKVGT
jgi:hypothetical protein